VLLSKDAVNLDFIPEEEMHNKRERKKEEKKLN